MNLIEAAQMALDALDSDNPDIQLRAATHLRAALAQPKQEPVAWMEKEKYTEGDKQFEQTLVRPYNSGRGVPLYTTPPHPWIDNKQTGNFFSVPPPQREWQGLTDEERQECLYSDPIFGMAASTFARAIEAKLKEKNA